MFSKRYKNAVILDNPKDATMISGMEGYGHVNYGMNDVYPVTLVLQKHRSYFRAVLCSMKYSRLGIFNLILKE